MTTRKRHNRPLVAVSLALSLALGTACDKLLEVENPGDVTEEALEGDQALPVLVNSAFGRIAVGFEDVVLVGGLFTDELVHTGSFTNFDRMDRRQTVSNDFLAWGFQSLSTARFVADLAVERVREANGSQALLAEALAHAGWARLLLAEHFCDITIASGPILTPAEVFGQAEGVLGEAIQAAQAAGEDDILNYARVGRARARLALGDNAGALVDAQAVPADFEFMMIYDAAANTNDVWQFTFDRREGGIQEQFQNDPRVPQCSVHPSKAPDVPECPIPTEGPLGPDNETPLFVQLLYTDRGSDMPIASGLMAQFLAQEAQGNVDPQEMGAELFLTGSRLGFLRRTNHPFLQGGQACFPLPERETDTNPNT